MKRLITSCSLVIVLVAVFCFIHFSQRKWGRIVDHLCKPGSLETYDCIQILGEPDIEYSMLLLEDEFATVPKLVEVFCREYYFLTKPEIIGSFGDIDIYTFSYKSICFLNDSKIISIGSGIIPLLLE